LDEINQLGLDLGQGKYYRLKFATSPWGSGWTEHVKYFYMLPENLELNGEIVNGDYFALENIIMQNATIGNEQNVILTAGNSIDIKPNSLIEFGSSFLAKIDPYIYSNCASLPFNDLTINFSPNKNDETFPDFKNTEYVLEIDSNNYKLYPNPTNGTFTIEGINGVSEITIYNAFGEKIKASEIFTKSVFDLSHYPKGIYLLTIKTNDRVFTEKVVLQ
jgi:hypothetical protein